MNLMKNFNFKFLKENIKQAKGILLFFLSIIPIANLVSLFLHVLNNENVLTFSSVSTITYIGMFVIPLAVAYVLFGFLFKKKSVDFYMSQPVNRKTIFLTNLIGGISLLLMVILTNTIIFKAFGLFTSLAMPNKLLLDYLIYFSISYLLIFVISTLSISLAGNAPTSIVITLLILFLIPFFRFSNFTLMKNNTSLFIPTTIKNICDNDLCRISASKNLSSAYITPLGFLFSSGVFRSKDVLLTLIYMLILIPLAYIAFKKRKMENNECSFKNPYLHFGIKTLTIIPFTFIIFLTLIDQDFNALLLFILIAFIYYMVYDIIMHKRIFKFKIAFFTFWTSLGIIIGLYALVFNFYSKNIILNNITELTFENYELNRENVSLTITDKTLIKELINDSLIRSNSNKNTYYNIHLVTIKNNNKDYNWNIDISKEFDEKIKEYATKNYHDYFDYQNIDYLQLYNDEAYPITKEIKKLLNDSQYKEGSFDYGVTYEAYWYTNHNYRMVTVPINVSKELLSHTIKKLNKDFINEYDKSTDGYVYIQRRDGSDNLIDYSEDFADYIFRHNKKEFIEYLKTLKFDANQKEFIRIIFGKYCYFITDIESFDKIYKTFKDNVKDDEAYQKLLEANTYEYYD